MIVCDECGADMPKETAHEFVWPDKTIMGRYCAMCCPRCGSKVRGQS